MYCTPMPYTHYTYHIYLPNTTYIKYKHIYTHLTYPHHTHITYT